MVQAVRMGVMSLVMMGSVAMAQTPTTDANERAAKAAEEAAAAAKTSAEAATRAAEAIERLAPPPAAPAGEAKAAAAPDEAPKSNWSGSAGLGVISLTGNSRSITMSGNLVAQFKTPEWIFGTKSSFIYGQSRPADTTVDPEVLALAAALQVQGDRRITQRVSVFVGTGVDTDHVKSVELRGYGEGGVGLLWLDDVEGDLQKRLLRTDIGMRYSREARFQFYPTRANVDDVTLVAPRIAATFLYALSKDVTFQQDAEVLTNILGDSRLIVNTLTKLSARLLANFSLGVGFAVKHDSSPAIGRVPTDTALTVGLEAGF